MTSPLILVVSLLAIGPALFAQEKSEVKAVPAKVAPTPSKPISAQAQELFDKGEFRKTADLLWKNIASLDRQGMLLLLKAHKARKEWNEVIRAANLALSRNARDEEAMTYLGEAQFRRQTNPEEAKETLKRAMEINPKHQPAYEIMALIYEKNPYERRLLYQDMIEIFGPKIEILTRLCELNAEDGENEQGERYCRQAIEKDSSVDRNHVYLGLIAKQKGETEAAKTRLRAAAVRFSGSEFAQFQYALLMEEEKNWIDANKFYEQCVVADSKSDRCWLGVGNSAIQLRQYERSVQAFSRACQLAGRKHSPVVRRAVSTIRQRKDLEWSDRLSRVAERCAYF